MAAAAVPSELGFTPLLSGEEPRRELLMQRWVMLLLPLPLCQQGLLRSGKSYLGSSTELGEGRPRAGALRAALWGASVSCSFPAGMEQMAFVVVLQVE